MQLTEAKRDYYSTKIEASNNDQKSLFDITNFELANRFSKFFNDKMCYANSDVDMKPLASVKLNNLISVTSDEIRDVITSCPNKSCQLDPIPTWF